MAVGSLISFPEEMKVIKTLFSSETLESGKKIMLDRFSPKNSVRIQGIKNEIMKFLAFGGLIFHFQK